MIKWLTDKELASLGTDAMHSYILSIFPHLSIIDIETACANATDCVADGCTQHDLIMASCEGIE